MRRPVRATAGWLGGRLVVLAIIIAALVATDAYRDEFSLLAAHMKGLLPDAGLVQRLEAARAQMEVVARERTDRTIRELQTAPSRSAAGIDARIEALEVRYGGALTDSRALDVLAASAAAGVLRPILSSGVSIVNARAAARARGIDIVEARSSRARDYAALLTITLKTDAGERCVEGTVFEPNNLRLVSARGVSNTKVVVRGSDPPGYHVATQIPQRRQPAQPVWKPFFFRF